MIARVCALVGALIVSSVLGAGETSPASKTASTGELIAALARLHDLAIGLEAEKPFEPDADRLRSLDAHVGSVVQTIQTADGLMRFALVTFAIAAPQDADTLREDAVYDTAYHLAVNRLAGMRGADATRALLMIGSFQHLENGEKESFDAALARQCRLSHADGICPAVTAR